MGKINSFLPKIIENIPDVNIDEFRKARRAAQVRTIWGEIADNEILAHTNNVFIFMKNHRRELHVYVDESIYAAEINMRQSILKLQFRVKFNEQIDDIYAHVSRGTWRNNYPYAEKLARKPININFAPPLDQKDQNFVNESVAKIHDQRLAKALKKAMTSDLRMKKLTDDKNHQ